MALLFEFLRPLLLAKLCCQILSRTISMIIETWLEVLRFALCVHFIVLWRLLILAFAVLSSPFRAYSALFRERMLETQIYIQKNDLENLVWVRNALEQKFHAAVTERDMIKTMLMELEEEHDEAIVKAETLEAEVQVLKAEIQRLKEVHGKSLSSLKINHQSTDEISQKPSPNSTKQMSKYTNGLSLQSYATHPISNEREVALSRTLFSAMLSIIVGIVVWRAENPCMPLVVALFTVVSMSLKSVMRFYTGIQHGIRYDAIVLLSINWFMLGTLAYPMLPEVVRFMAPLVLAFVKWSF